MKLHHLLIVTCFLAACKSKPTKHEQDTTKSKTVKVLPASFKASSKVTPTDTSDFDELRDAYADYYVVVADTGLNYYTLRDRMFDLSRNAGLTIDTGGQYYDKQKDMIRLPDNDEDEVLAGEYVMRRYPSKTLSLEYLASYKDNSAEKTIALVTGIYENKASADSALEALQPSKTAFAIKSHIYIGCIH
ncbi:hypothetical protein AAFN85_15885 [Mucilaginibacter sp. CAU 1740]|uniref:hypothetical protein n=1 Tax=Mucilaginibacter sp. CAU 1740 TaxID=3140365 RepID=UPI00325AE874